MDMPTNSASTEASTNAELRARVLAWQEHDPDPATRARAQELLDAGDASVLADHFDERLVFGTAGIRGPVDAGPNRMNLAVVRQTAWGLASVLLDVDRGGSNRPTVVLGHDARPDSARFAHDFAGVLAAAGVEVARFADHVPTPLVAWLARHRETDAAVVVTASHNPRGDNGIKVYDRRSIQITPPLDGWIADAINRAPGADQIPVDLTTVEELDTSHEDAYRREMIASLPEGDRRRGQVIVATALHGVGAAPLDRLLGEAGFEVHQVPEQREPDGSFPTVPFPNPEEPGALDLALRHGRALGADLILANDPDADRLALALPSDDEPGGEGGHRPLTGNEIGMLLADILLHDAGERHSEQLVVASSIVSSPQLTELAATYGAEHRTTLTGFKWVWTALLDAELAGATPLFGYEEALGYAVNPAVRDKDGLSAALVVVDAAAREAARGRTLNDRLDDIARATGLWASTQRSVRFEGPDADVEAIDLMASLRAAPPQRLGALEVTDQVDFRVGADQRPSWLGDQNLLAFTLAGVAEGGGPALRGRLLVRPSGTEPKVKFYVDLRASVLDGTEPRRGRHALAVLAGHLGDEAVRMADPERR